MGLRNNIHLEIFSKNNIKSMATRQILDNYETLGYVFFTFTGIKMELNKKGEEKKNTP